MGLHLSAPGSRLTDVAAGGTRMPDASRSSSTARRTSRPSRTRPSGRDARCSSSAGTSAAASASAATAAGERWRRATGVRLPEADRVASDPWPAGVAADVDDVAVAIARTEPAWRERPAVHEIEQLHLDAIASARRSIYLEAQYVTAGCVGA